MENSKIIDSKRAVIVIGSCGFYCKSCREFTKGLCKGCKVGYKSGERDINRAKCKIKLCCFKEKNLETCADCADYLSCKLIHNRFKGYQLKKCLEINDFIRNNGYANFTKIADNWNNHYGKLE